MKKREEIIIVETAVSHLESLFRPGHSFPQLEEMLAADSSQMSSPGWRAMICPRVCLVLMGS